jgi:uncharacterized protein YjbJ (UPF0337 family)
MGIDKRKIRTQDDLKEPAPIDQVEDRVEATMKKLEGSAKKDVGEGLQNEEIARQGDKLKKEGERDLRKAGKKTG